MIDFNKLKLPVEGGQDPKELTNEQAQEKLRHSALVGFVTGFWTTAKAYRMGAFDNRAMDAYRSWRGIHSPEEDVQIQKMRERNALASSIFVKITKTKVQAAVAQLNEILFADGKVPIGVEATPVPEGVAETIHLSPNKQEQQGPVDIYGYAGDGKDIKPGATHADLLRGLDSTTKSLVGSNAVNNGPSPDPSQAPQFHPAQEAAYRMDKQLQDQMEESKVRREIAKGVDELPLLGTMVLKGPFTAASQVTEWYRDAVMGRNKARTTYKLRPMMKQVSCWDVYPTPGAVDIDDVEQIVERHRFTKSGLRRLKKLPFFDKKAIDEILLNELPTSSLETFESHIKDDTMKTGTRYEVLEYWGYLDAELIRFMDLDEFELPEDYEDPIQVNIWVCNGYVIRAMLNPFETQALPYFFVPYERHPWQLWGIGIPENMKDTQDLMNGHMRMSIDNLRLSGNVMLEINQTRFAKGQDLSFFPGKAFFTQGGAVNQSIYPIQIPNVAPQHMQMFDKARQLADDQTGFPSVSHGQTGISGTGRTASGMSMLMSAAAMNIKQVVKNIDDYLLEPMGEALFRWNMDFNEDMPEIFGDERIVAKGTSALMQKEVHSQRLMMFLNVAQNSPFANLPYIFREIAKSLNLDPDKVVVDQRTAMLQAQLMGAQNGNSQQAANQQPNAAAATPGAGPAQPPAAGANPSDQQGTGDGTIGFGTPPIAG